jgi:site-specific DNA-methyltransferase (cytosine-N4-specific)
MSDWLNKTHQGDCRTLLQQMADAGVTAQMCVTSPPYWGGLRDYGMDAQIGLERDPVDYVDEIVEVGRGVRKVLVPGGTFWINVGDAYAASGKGGGGIAGKRFAWESVRDRKGFRMPPTGYKMKDLVLASFAVAEALRADGWYLRSTIIWRKPSAVEPTRLDRPAVSHEYLFLLSNAEVYTAHRPGASWWAHSVWDITQDRDGVHPAAFPCELAARCIEVGSRPGDTVLDPFMGFGTVAKVATDMARKFIGIELNPEFIELQANRHTTQGMAI